MKTLFKISGAMLAILFLSTLAGGEPLFKWGSKKVKVQTTKPGMFSSGWGDSDERSASGKLGRGSDYTSQINPTPLKFKMGATESPFDTQY